MIVLQHLLKASEALLRRIGVEPALEANDFTFSAHRSDEKLGNRHAGFKAVDGPMCGPLVVAVIGVITGWLAPMGYDPCAGLVGGMTIGLKTVSALGSTLKTVQRGLVVSRDRIRETCLSELPWLSWRMYWLSSPAHLANKRPPLSRFAW